MTVAVSVLEGLDLAKKHTDDLGGYVWIGQDVYKKFRQVTFDNNQEKFDLKELNLTLKSVKVLEEHRYPIVPPAFTFQSEPREGIPAIPEGAENDEEIQRSIINRNKVCQCGSKKALSVPVRIARDGQKKHTRQTVMVGGLRRTRCKKCEGCLAEPCRKCNFCLVPSMKKPCKLRVCRFPVIPKCPCFV